MIPLVTLLQASKGIAGIPPEIQPDVSLWLVLGFAVLNPAVIAVAWLLGHRADERAKLLVAAFAAAIAGVALVWLGALLRLPLFTTAGRAGVGIFVAAGLVGYGVAAAAYAARRR